MPKAKTPKHLFTYEEVQILIQTIWSEFVELESGMHTPYFLRHIIEVEIENHLVKPIQIFKPESRRETNAGLLIAQNRNRIAELEQNFIGMAEAVVEFLDDLLKIDGVVLPEETLNTLGGIKDVLNLVKGESKSE